MSANPNLFPGVGSIKGKTAGGLIPAASLKQASTTIKMDRESKLNSKTTPANSGVYGVSKQQPKMVSGTGQFHSDKTRKYDTITWDEITAMVDDPMQVDKANARWFIPSTTITRTFEEQRQNGLYYALWADLDGDGDIPPPLKDKVVEIVTDVIGGCNHEIYSSRSAKESYQKWHVIIPLDAPLQYATWAICQMILNETFQDAGYKPDLASQRAGQLCYLPNRGEFYESDSQRTWENFSPESQWSEKLNQKRALIEQVAAITQARKEAAQARKVAISESEVTSQPKSLIDAFNGSYDVGSILTQAGYDEGHTDAKGTHYRHPSSETGNYSACVFHESGKVFTVSSNDKLYNDGSHAHDAFSAFRCTIHNGDINAALKDAGDNWIMVGNDSWNKVAQRNYMQDKSKVEPLDFSKLPNAKPLANDVIDLDTGEIIHQATNQCPPPFRGVMKAVVDEILDTSPQYQPELAMAGALSGMGSGLMGMFKQEDGLRNNLYIAGIAPTGAGKDTPRRAAVNLARACDTETLGRIASGQGLEDVLSDHRAYLAQWDEFGHVMEQFNAKHRPTHVAELVGLLLNLYTESKGIFVTRLKVDLLPRRVLHPCLNILGFTTPEAMGSALSSINVSDGTLGRFFFVNGRERQLPRLDLREFELPQIALDQANGIKKAVYDTQTLNGFNDISVNGVTMGSGVSSLNTGLGASIMIRFDGGAKQYNAELNQRIFDQSLLPKTNPYSDQLLIRDHEKIKRIAGVLAVWDCPSNPVVTVEHLEWAEQFNCYSNETLLSFMEGHVHGGDIQANAALVMKLIERTVSGEFEPQTARDDELIKKGYAPHTLLLQRSKLDTRQFADAIAQLIDGARIYCNESEITTGRGKKMKCKYYEILDE